MRPSTSSLLCLLPLSACVAADIATINPCPQDTDNTKSITVVSQYQPVSTCIPYVQNGVTTYSYSTYAYVSTTIPVKADGTTTSNVVVTDTAQWITVTKLPEETQTGVLRPRGDALEIVQRQGLCPYNAIGDWIVPGWAGSGLCKECNEVAADGSRRQKIRMQECRCRGTYRSCIEYDQVWTSSPVPQPTAVQYPVCGTRSAVPVAGTYTFTFPQPAITSCITLSDSTITATQPSWTAYVTRSCGGPTVFDFTTTVTKTVTLFVPWNTDRPTFTWTRTDVPPYITDFPIPVVPTGPKPSVYTLSDGSTLTLTGSGMMPTGGPTITGPFTTVTVTPGGPDIGTTPVTVTVGPSIGTTPGTVIVVEPTPTNTLGPAPDTTFPTGPYVTVTITPTGSIPVTTEVTITVAPPSGTLPGTVIIVDPTGQPPSSTASSTTSSSGNPTNSPVLTGGSSTTGAGSTTTSGTAIVDPVSTSFTSSMITITPTTLVTMTSGSTISTTCVGLICVGVSASVSPIIDVGVSATVLPGTTTTPTATTTQAPTDGSGNGDGNCTGLLCASVGVGIPIIDIGGRPRTSTATTTTATGSDGSGTNDPNCTGLLCVSVGVSDPVIGATATIGVGNGGSPTTDAPSSTTDGVGNGTGDGDSTCTGLLCVSVGASVPVVGATATVGIGRPIGNIDIGLLPTGTSTTAPTTSPSVGSGTDDSTCTGLLCVSVGASAPIVGATATVGIGRPIGNIDIGLRPTSTLTMSAAMSSSVELGTGDAPCTGLLCVSVGASAPVVGATATVGIGRPIGNIDIGLRPTSTSTTTAAEAGSMGSGTGDAPCTGLLCVSVGVSAPVLDATVTAGVGNGGATTSGQAAATTTSGCTGLLCASVGASVPIIDTGATITAGIGNNGGNNGAPSTTSANNAGATTTPCTGLLCASVGVGIPIVDIAIRPSTTSVQTTAVTPTAPCTGLLCASVGVSDPVVDATVTAGLINGNGPANPSSTTGLAGAGGSATCSGLLCASIGASLPIIDTGATVTAGIGNNGGNGGAPPSTTVNNAAATTTPCTGLLCASVGVNAPVISAGVTVTVGVGNNGGNVSPVSSTTTGAAAAAAETAPCTGILCASVGVNVPVISTGATVTAGIANGNGPASSSPTTSAPGVGGATKSCSGLLCASVGANVPVIDTGATVIAGIANGGGNTTPAAPVATTTRASGSNGGTCSGLLCASVGVNVPIIDTGATVTAGVLNNPQPSSAAAPRVQVAVTTSAARVGVQVASTTAPRVQVAATTSAAARVDVQIAATSSAARIQVQVAPTSAAAAVRTTLATIATPNKVVASVSASLKVLGRKSEATGRSTIPRSFQGLAGKRYSDPCYSTLNICDGLDLKSLFTTQPCSSALRLGCLLSNTLNKALNSCASSNCGTYGVTNNGLFGLTTSLSIGEIQDRISAYASAHGGVCNIGQTVKLYANTDICRS